MAYWISLESWWKWCVCESVGNFDRGNISTGRKPTLVLLSPLQIPHEVACARNHAATVEIWRLFGWDISRPVISIWSASKLYDDPQRSSSSVEDDYGTIGLLEIWSWVQSGARLAVAEARGHLEDRGERDRSPLEAGTWGLMKRQQTGKIHCVL